MSVALPDRYLLLGALVVHGLPLAGLLGGATAAAALTGSDLGAAGGALAGMLVALLGTPAVRARLERATLRRVEVRAAQSAGGPDAYTHSL